MAKETSWLESVLDAEAQDIPALIERWERQSRRWRLASLLLVLAGMAVTTFCRGDLRLIGGGLVLGGVALLCIRKINAHTGISAIWIVSEIRKLRRP